VGDMSPPLWVWGETPAAKRFPGHYRGLRDAVFSDAQT